MKQYTTAYREWKRCQNWCFWCYRICNFIYNTNLCSSRDLYFVTSKDKATPMQTLYKHQIKLNRRGSNSGLCSSGWQCYVSSLWLILIFVFPLWCIDWVRETLWEPNFLCSTAVVGMLCLGLGPAWFTQWFSVALAGSTIRQEYTSLFHHINLMLNSMFSL